MAISKRDKELRLPKISYLDFKTVELDRILTGLYMRLAHNGFSSRLRKRVDKTLEDFVDEFCEDSERFQGFGQHRDVVRRWVETDLLDIVNRGKPNQAVAAPRPLHGFTYRFRNPKHSRAYGADQHIYELLFHARGSGNRAIEHLKAFCFEGYDPVTERPQPEQLLDVETQALLHLSEQVEDAADTGAGRDSYPPLCVGSADLLAEDIQRILFYQKFIPRSVMVEYLKVLIAFHLGLYHLRLIKLLPALVKRKGADPICSSSACPMDPKSHDNPFGDCPYKIGMLVDMIGKPGSSVAELAERSLDSHYRRIVGFIRAYFATRKLDEFADDLVRRGKITKPDRGYFTVGEVLELLDTPFKSEREKFFGQRISSLLEDTASPSDSEVDPELRAVTEMGLPEFESYIEMLVSLRGPFHRKYIIESLDSLFLKNKKGAFVAQGRTRNARRRFVMDTRLLEVLLQIAVLKPGGVNGFYTADLRIDELLVFLKQRYGVYVDELPFGDGFGSGDIQSRRALRDNYKAFVERLREIGFYRDLSDAYVAQTITPRYKISSDEMMPGGDR